MELHYLQLLYFNYYAYTMDQYSLGSSDSLSFLPISIILCFRKWWIIMPFTIIGCLNDERFILSIPFLLLWWWPANLKSFKDIIQIIKY